MAKTAKNQLVELTVNYNYGIKANIGNYESATVGLSRTEKWNTEGMTEEEIQKLYEERLTFLKTDIDARIEEEYKGVSNYG